MWAGHAWQSMTCACGCDMHSGHVHGLDMHRRHVHGRDMHRRRGQDAGMHGSHACHRVPVMHAIVVSERHGIVYMCQ